MSSACRWCNQPIQESLHHGFSGDVNVWSSPGQHLSGFSDFVCPVLHQASLAGQIPVADPPGSETWHAPWPPRPDMTDREELEAWLDSRRCSWARCESWAIIDLTGTRPCGHLHQAIPSCRKHVAEHAGQRSPIASKCQCGELNHVTVTRG